MFWEWIKIYIYFLCHIQCSIWFILETRALRKGKVYHHGYTARGVEPHFLLSCRSIASTYVSASPFPLLLSSPRHVTQRSWNAALRMQGGGFSKKGGCTKTSRSNFVHMKEGSEIHVQTLICSRVLSVVKQERKHRWWVLSRPSCWQQCHAFQHRGVRIKDIEAISSLFSISSRRCHSSLLQVGTIPIC